MDCRLEVLEGTAGYRSYLMDEVDDIVSDVVKEVNIDIHNYN